jgi:fumarate reductase flavoprotein subunit
MVKRCADCGFDLAGGLVEVVPTAHYLMGGVVCEPDTSTEMANLYVAGEDAGGAHGANRLGGNGVANSTVFGGIAGDTMARHVTARSALPDADEEQIQDAMDRALRPFGEKPGDLNELRDKLLDLMWDHVGVIRTAGGLQTGLDALAGLKAELAETGLAGDSRLFNLTWHDWLNLESLITVSEVVARAALSRENSRGAHYREDYRQAGDLDASAFTVARRSRAEISVTQQPVAFTIVRPGESLIAEAGAAE